MPLLIPQTGGLVELDIPQHVDILTAQQGCDGHNRRETNVVRWSNVNSPAKEFKAGGNRLRASIYAEPRTTKLLVSIRIDASHSVGDVRKAISAAAQSVNGVNSAKFSDLTLSWKNVVILLIGSVDEMKPEVVDLLGRLGIYRTENMDDVPKGSVGQTFEYTALLKPASTSASPSPYQLILFSSHTPLTVEEANEWALYAIADTLSADIWIPLQVGQTVGIPGAAFAHVVREFHQNGRYLSITVKDYISSELATAQILSPFAQGENVTGLDRKDSVLKEATQAKDKVCAYRLTLDSLPLSLTFE